VKVSTMDFQPSTSKRGFTSLPLNKRAQLFSERNQFSSWFYLHFLSPIRGIKEQYFKLGKDNFLMHPLVGGNCIMRSFITCTLLQV
jgi:hypothetical protein